MDIVGNILFWLHFIGLGLGAAASFALPVVGAQMPTATAETRPTLFRVSNGLSTLGRAGLATLIVTGPLLVWLKFGGTDGFTAWFWAKMVFVVLLLITVIYAGIQSKQAQTGNIEAAKRMPMISLTAIVLFVCVVFCAVFAFN
jgi:protoporphyrinogen IX oxidase